MTVILTPAAAADLVCHDEQLRIWAHDHIVSALALGDWLRQDLSYDDQIELEQCMMHEIKSIIQMALDHPEARTIRRLSPLRDRK